MFYYTSDQHFYHKNILKFCQGRANLWNDVDEMNEGLIENWNSVVNDDDTVFSLGDICFGNIDIVNRLKGKIVLVQGNHDKVNVLKSDRFETIVPYLEIKDNNKKIILCHYKFECWNMSHHGSFHFYGHSHGMRPGDNQCCDVGVDSEFTNFTPVNFAQISEYLETQPVRKEY